jgi:hypothetical protein
MLTGMFMLIDTAYALRPQLLFNKGITRDEFLLEQKDWDDEIKKDPDVLEFGPDIKIWKIPVAYANERIAPELKALFDAAEDESIGISKLMLGGGTARDFVFGVFLGINTVDESSDLDIIVLEMRSDKKLFDKFKALTRTKSGLAEIPDIDPVLGLMSRDAQPIYKYLYKNADVSLARLLVKKTGEFYIIIDLYDGVKDIKNKTLRFSNLKSLEDGNKKYFETEIFQRYIPYWAKLIKYGFDYDPYSRKIIDDYLERGDFNLVSVLDGFGAIFIKAQTTGIALKAIKEFGFAGILEKYRYLSPDMPAQIEKLTSSVEDLGSPDVEKIQGIIERLRDKAKSEQKINKFAFTCL